MSRSFGTTCLTSLLLATALSVGTAQAQANKSVTIVWGDEPNTLDQCAGSASYTGRVINQTVVEAMTELQPDGSITPRLATSWERKDDLTWRFKLRENVTFHDGAKFNADSVVKALDRVNTVTFVCELRNKYWSAFKAKAVKIDDYTVDIVTDKPWPIMPLYAGGLPIVSPNTPSDKLQLTAVGTGPYVLDHWTQQQEIVLKKNPNYWDKDKKLEVDSARYIFRKESSVQAAMAAIGEADLAPSISVNDANNPKTDISYPNAETTYLRIDMAIPPLDDKRVRMALNYAIDRQAMLGPIFPPGSMLATQMWGPGVKGHNFEIDKKVWPYDPARAKQLLAEAKADGVKVDTEIELQGRMAVYPNAQELMEAALQYYKDVGLNVKLKMYELAQWTGLQNKPFREGRGPGLLQASHDNATGDAGFSAPYKHSCKGGTSALCDPVIDQMIEEAGQMKDEARIKAYQEIARRLHEDIVDAIYLVHQVSFARVNPRITYKPNTLTNVKTKLEDITFN